MTIFHGGTRRPHRRHTAHGLHTHRTELTCLIPFTDGDWILMQCPEPVCSLDGVRGYLRRGLAFYRRKVDIRYLSKCNEVVGAKVLSPLSQAKSKISVNSVSCWVCAPLYTMAPNKLHSIFLVATSLRIIEQKSRLKFWKILNFRMIFRMEHVVQLVSDSEQFIWDVWVTIELLYNNEHNLRGCSP